MTTALGFVRAADGVYELVVDPDADKDYSIAWSAYLNGDQITSSTFTIAPSVAGSPYSAGINTSGPVTIDGTEHPIRSVTTCWIKDLIVGFRYLVTNRVTTSGGRTDDFSFRLICAER